MCGILAILYSTEELEMLRRLGLEASKILRHRGPDWNGIYVQQGREGTRHCFAHERLAIVDPFSGKQPLFAAGKKIAVTANGEIYNHMALRELLGAKVVETFETQSDCEVIGHLFEKFGKDMVHKLDGMWAFVASDERSGAVLAARDPMGICPLYIGYGDDGAVWIASEFKALAKYCTRFEIFPPGHRWTPETGLERWYEPGWWDPSKIPSTPLQLPALREALEAAVRKRLMADVPFGVLLSGGLDSSLIASIATRELQRQPKTILDAHLSAGPERKAYTKLHSFSVGLPGAPDLVAARKVADFLGTVHHEFTFDVEEGVDALQDVIYHLETFDVTTIRASTPMYFLSRKLKSTGVKMVLSGEGADEIFGGYLYFHKAPNKEAFHEECVKKLHSLHMYDVLRANKSTQAWGVEARVPFLDKFFLETAMSLDPQEKMCVPGERIEKWCIRKAFADSGYLPDDILWRQKEQFSDGVGYSWIDGLKEYAERVVTDQQLARAPQVFPKGTPGTKEAYLYRQIFARHFPQQSATETVPSGPSIACSTPAALAWDASFRKNADASGRALLGVHVDGKTFSDAQAAGEREAKKARTA